MSSSETREKEEAVQVEAGSMYSDLGFRGDINPSMPISLMGEDMGHRPDLFVCLGCGNRVTQIGSLNLWFHGSL